MVVRISGDKRKRLLHKELKSMLPQIKRLGAKKVIPFAYVATGDMGLMSDEEARGFIRLRPA